MPIDIDIAHVARLARLALDDQELETYKTQLGVILDHAGRVQSLEGEAHVESAHPLGFVNAFRDDEVKPSLDRGEVLEQAPESRDGFFVAPPAIELEG
jgi:aspartyl-tRNA(Asn)/glutamyl-tRNA(Gln) amidotransferase subunit C